MEYSIRFEIARSGKLCAYYTLYAEKTITSEHFNLHTRFFIQNLSMEEDAAWKKGVAIKNKYESANEELKTSIDIFDSPKREYCDLRAFGIPWTKTQHGFCGCPDSAFWDIWKKHKSILKDAGFSVFRGHNGEFVAFFRNTSQDEMIEALQSMDGKIAVAKETGDYAGQVGDRLRDIKITIHKLFENRSFYGTTQILYFSDKTGRAYMSKYSGQHEFKQGDNYTIAATIKELRAVAPKNWTIW